MKVPLNSLLCALLTVFVFLSPGTGNIAQAATSEPDWIYTARPGDTVKSIADKYLANTDRWSDLLRYNNISNTNLLQPGTLVKIPVRLLKSYPKAATLLVSQGKVWLRKAHSTPYIPALSGSRLNIGDELKTQKGFALVKFADGSNLRIAENSIIIFNTLTHYGETGMVDTRFRLNKGGIKTEVTPRKGAAARYEVSTPSAVAAVRGTAFRMRIAGNKTVTEVTKGKVLVSNATSNQVLRRGQGAALGSTGTFNRIELLPAPETDIPPSLEQLPFTIKWKPVPGAVSYMVELSKKGSDNLPFLAHRMESPNLQLPDLPNGEYQVFIRGIDQNNIEGLDAEIYFKIEQEAEPAELITPLSGAALHDLQPEFSWRVNTPVLLSSLEIARDASFSNLFARTPFTRSETGSSERPLSAGEYYWRVVTMAGGEKFAYSDSRPLTIQGRLQDTRVIAVNYLEDQAKIFWKSIPNAESYLVQLSEDELFKRLVKEDEQQTTHAMLRLVPGKTYWVRVKGIGNEFYASGFGESQILKIQP